MSESLPPESGLPRKPMIRQSTSIDDLMKQVQPTQLRSPREDATIGYIQKLIFGALILLALEWYQKDVKEKVAQEYAQLEATRQADRKKFDTDMEHRRNDIKVILHRLENPVEISQPQSGEISSDAGKPSNQKRSEKKKPKKKNTPQKK